MKHRAVTHGGKTPYRGELCAGQNGIQETGCVLLFGFCKSGRSCGLICLILANAILSNQIMPSIPVSFLMLAVLFDDQRKGRSNQVERMSKRNEGCGLDLGAYAGGAGDESSQFRITDEAVFSQQGANHCFRH